MNDEGAADTQTGLRGARRLKPGDFAQVDGLHGLFQVRLDVPPQFVRVRLCSCGKEGEIVRRCVQSQGKRVGGGSGGGTEV